MTNKVCNKNIANNLLKNVTELLQGTLVHQTVVNSKGQTKKQIIISYDEEEK